MASKFPGGAWGGGGKSGAELAAEAEAKSKAAALAEQNFKNHVKEGEEAFKKKYGSYPKDYVLEKKKAAYGTSSKDSGYAGRSAAGKKHADEPEKEGTLGEVKAYHDMEEIAKECARSGDIPGAIEGYSKAADMREAYEEKYSKAPDAGHAHRVIMLRQRRNSLIGLQNTLDATDPDVVAAKVTVQTFFKAGKVDYPV